MAIIDELMQLFTSGQDAANQANQGRYRDIMRQLNRTSRQTGRTYRRAGQLTRRLGRSGRRDINRQAGEASASMLQSMIDRGLGSTTITDSLQRQIDRDANEARQSLNEQVQGQRAGILMSQAGSQERMGGLIAQMMENRTDQGPDSALIAQLMSQLGQGQGAAGGGGGGSSFQVSGDAGSLGRAWMERNFGAGAGGGSGAAYGTAGSGGGYYAGPGSAGAARAGSGGTPPGGGGFTGFPRGGGGGYMGQDPGGAMAGMIPGMGGGMFTQGTTQGYVGENPVDVAGGAPGGAGGAGGGMTMADMLWQATGDENTTLADLLPGS